MGKPKAMVNQQHCLACGGCISVCPQDAITMDGGRAFVLKQKCFSCALCIRICPIGVISEEGC